MVGQPAETSRMTLLSGLTAFSQEPLSRFAAQTLVSRVGRNYLGLNTTENYLKSLPWGQKDNGYFSSSANGGALTFTPSSNGTVLVFATVNLTESLSKDLPNAVSGWAGYAFHYISTLPVVEVRVAGAAVSAPATISHGLSGSSMICFDPGPPAVDLDMLQASSSTCMGTMFVSKGVTYEFSTVLNVHLDLSPSLAAAASGAVKKIQLIGSGSDINVIFIKSWGG